jgi:hypothetical protein
VRSIHYKDGTEELYNVKKDPNEWRNLAAGGGWENQAIIDEMKKVAPEEFSLYATPRETLDLIVDGDTFHWEKKDNSR